MRNIWAVCIDDIKRMSKSVIAVCIVVGLIVVPCIFAWYNTIAAWDVFNNTGNLKVAVVNNDEGYKSDLVPFNINVGEQVVSKLRANNDIDWVFTDEDDALDGAKLGTYYAAVVIPESFSRDMITFYSNDIDHAEIIYYANTKKNAIAPKITDRSADTISYEINQVFAETLSEVSLSIVNSFITYADDADVRSRLETMSAHIKTVSARMNEVADVLELYAQLSDSTQELLQGTVCLVDNAEHDANSTIESVQQGLAGAESTLGTVKHSTDVINAALVKSEASFAEVEKTADDLFASASTTSTDVVKNLRATATGLRAEADSYTAVISSLEAIRDTAPSGYKDLVNAAVNVLSANQRSLLQLAASLEDSATGIEVGVSSSAEEYSSIQAEVAAAKKAIANLQEEYDATIAPGLSALQTEVARLNGNLNTDLEKLGSLSGGLSETTISMADILSQTSGGIQGSSQNIRDVSSSLEGLADDLDAALHSPAIRTIRDIVGSDVSELAVALCAPVGVERIAIYPVENFGSAMSGLYTTLALFIGSLLILVLLKPNVAEEVQERLGYPKPHELFLGHFGIMAIISLLQTTLMGLGNILFLQVQVIHPVLFMLCFWIAGLVFTFLIYAMVAAFGNLGKGIAVLLLIAQITGCGGSFPLPLLPGFVETISPYLPATHVVRAIHAAMMGIYQNDYWIEIGKLLLFLIPAGLIGLVLRKPLERFMSWYIAKVESSHLIN